MNLQEILAVIAFTLLVTRLLVLKAIISYIELMQQFHENQLQRREILQVLNLTNKLERILNLTNEHFNKEIN